MRCSKLCLGLIIIGIGGAAILASTGNTQAASFLSVLPFLACPLMCVVMMMTGHKCDDDKCQTAKQKKRS
ncbi:hypothetical protein A2635_01710 [Candidatus Peribacteria bacterium RIFCSPHIGHO2_01_FULL_51_9]|nr:MAG: hypothetical protein A2635_01710 [Candidatus Peribacteria bacterium RIFCSPHIGHO2_01_FULL_51_9]